jgi:hypothetical protein
MNVRAKVTEQNYPDTGRHNRHMLLFSFYDEHNNQVGRAEVDLEKHAGGIGAIVNWMEVYPLFQEKGVGVIQNHLIESELHKRGIGKVGLVASRRPARFWRREGYQKAKPDSSGRFSFTKCLNCKARPAVHHHGKHPCCGSALCHYAITVQHLVNGENF